MFAVAPRHDGRYENAAMVWPEGIPPLLLSREPRLSNHVSEKFDVGGD